MPERMKDWRNYVDPNVRNPVFIIEVLLVVLLVSILYAVTSLRAVTNDLSEEQRARIQLSTQNQKILKQIESCTTPDGECAKRGEVQGAALAERINQVSVYAAYCASVQPPPADVAAVEECVRKQMER